ncbi:Os11g0459700 [Oryza sativa Japonica Group]|uniref:Os11g0459700 protein n=1 Tax=Oryza sativa subsp. japonica TaxID=39947 RepID=Q0ISU5_ORYSJ|nr:Os11g0459700 [Oryza sativa Japonica Group]|eukprot:NP_001067857.2 Os11g0459700 [Oryza sativa Japonica Group]
MSLLVDVKTRLVNLRNDAWQPLFEEDPFSKFDIDKIARLTEIYDQDFSNADPSNIRDQLETFILHVPRIDDFVGCHYFGSLAIKIVETEKNTEVILFYNDNLKNELKQNGRQQRG